MIQLLGFPKELKEEFQTEANKSGGYEVCAVLVGKSGNLSGTVEDIRFVENIAPYARKQFIMDPEDFLEAIEDTNLFAENASKLYLGIIHSHYYDKPYPSITDWAGAVEKRLYHGVYLIYSVFHEPNFRGFYWNGNEFIKMELLL